MVIVLIVTTENLNSDLKRFSSPALPICSHVLFRFIRLLQDDAERRKENLEKMLAANDRSTPEWLTRHVSKPKDVENI